MTIVVGDCIEVMRGMDAASVDAIVTDPPYNLSFMGRTWDRFDGQGIDPTFLAWLSGFVDGEGCFSVHRKVVGRYETFDCQFSISLRADDRPILERIHRTLRIGTLSRPDAHATGTDNPKARYSVSAKAELLLLREILRAFPLRAKKATDFEIWSAALDEWVGHERGEWESMARLRDALMSNREFKPEGVRIDPFQMWCYRWGREALRVLKPGGHILAFAGSRTWHRLTAGLEDAGFEIRDTIRDLNGEPGEPLLWIYGSGFPKSLDVAKALDKAERGVPQGGADPTSVNHGRYKTQATEGKRSEGDRGQGFGAGPGAFMAEAGQGDERELSDEAREWQGWGTALKPAHEPIIVARKPLAGTVAANVQQFGTGALNIDGCRINGAPRATGTRDPEASAGSGTCYLGSDGARQIAYDENLPSGRWPANVVLVHAEGCVRVGTESVASNGHHPAARPASTTDGGPVGHGGQEGLDERHARGEIIEVWRCVDGCPVAALDAQSGVSKSAGGRNANISTTSTIYGGGKGLGQDLLAEDVRGDPGFGDVGGASRFFYTAKASRAERNAGLEAFEKKPLLWSSGEQSPGTFQAEGTEKAARNNHPTVKPITLMRWLVRLVTRPGGLVLDPFAGSGTTGIACALESMEFVGIEQDADYAKIAEARIAFWTEHGEDALRIVAERDAAQRKREAIAETGQLDLLAGL